jgi:hypothetical protein
LSIVGTGCSDTTVFIDNIRITGATPLTPSEIGATAVSSNQINLNWSGSSGASSYHVTRSTSSGGPYTQVANVTSTSYEDSTRLPGTAYYYLVLAVNPVGASTISSEVSATTFTGLQQWRLANFGSINNNGNAANIADPDSDDRSNFIEYATGTEPLISNSGSLLTIGHSDNGTRLTLTFQRIADPNLMYIVESSDDLTSTAGGAIWSSNGISNLAGNVTVTDTEPFNNHTKRFLRLRIAQ